MKHTNGPWIHGELDGDVVCVWSPDIGTIATVNGEMVAHKSNAALIAAAPELLAALETLLYKMGHAGCLVGREYEEQEARAVIAKARGKQ